MSHFGSASHPAVLRTLTVTRIADVTPRMRRFTIAGPELAPHVRDGIELPGFASSGFDDYVKLVFADVTEDDDFDAEGSESIAGVLPTRRGASLDWPKSRAHRLRKYTVRRVDPANSEIDLDFVRHGTGPAGSWAERASVGDSVFVLDPKSSSVVPADVDWVLLAGDETALPAIGRYLDDRLSDQPVKVIVELSAASARQNLPLRETDELTWIVTAPGEASLLGEAVATTNWWDGAPFVWAAAESAALKLLRRRLADVCDVPKHQRKLKGYWNGRQQS